MSYIGGGVIAGFLQGKTWKPEKNSIFHRVGEKSGKNHENIVSQGKVGENVKEMSGKIVFDLVLQASSCSISFWF